jgi:TetR/AcrR family transcriptional regulator, regulator of autoinduction and epiphytic fitness
MAPPDKRGSTAATAGNSPTVPGAEPALAIDGRTLRSQRTRQAIIDAHMALMLAGDLQPTASRVAERAGVSLRVLWTHFKDLETLFGAAGEKALAIQFAEYHPIPTDLPLAERIDQFCRQRARMLNSIAGASRAAQIRLPFSRQLHANRVRHNVRLRAEIEQLFAVEIAARPGPPDKLVTAMLSATTWASWMGCLDDLELSYEEAVEVMRYTVAGLLGAAPPAVR